MKRYALTAWLLCVLMLLAAPMSVCAEQPESMETLSKTYTINFSETQGSIDADPAVPAFWEYPIFRNGESYTEGTLVLTNNSQYPVTMELNEVVLPYGDSAKLAYLDNLDLVVKEGNKVIFDDTYAHVNDPEDGLRIKINNMSPGEKRIYTIKLNCHFDYEGDPNADVSQLTWAFGASTQTTTYNQPNGLPLWLTIVLIVLGAAIVAVGVIMVLRMIKDKKENAK